LVGLPRYRRLAVDQNKQNRLSSENLAALIVDALIDAKLVQKEKVEEAIKVATVEIDVRKSLGDY
jgi:hypothetical protein